jgi:peroxiredoxin Q/BCP
MARILIPLPDTDFDTTEMAVPWRVLTDAGHAVAKQFGAYRPWLPGGLHTRRRTFVIGRDGRLLGEVADEKRFDRHADQALQILQRAAS